MKTINAQYKLEDWVNSVAFLNDDRFIVSGSRKNTIKIWDRKTGNELRCIDAHDKEVKCLDVSKDGRFIVSGSDDNTIKLWDRDTKN